MQQQVHKTKMSDTAELRQLIQTVWEQLYQCVIDRAVQEWRICLRACVKVKGGYFEHTL